MKSMTTNRLWTEEEDEAIIEMFCQGKSIHYIRLRLPRPDDAPIRTANAINARMNLLYTQGKINITRGDGNPREFNLEAEIEERVNQVLADFMEKIQDIKYGNFDPDASKKIWKPKEPKGSLKALMDEYFKNLPDPANPSNNEEE